MRFALAVIAATSVALAALALVPACGGGSTAPAQTGAAVGKVAAADGAVTATRTGATRTLGAGAEIFADDTIATGPDASVTIELFHNGAVWTLGASKQRAVVASAAWKAPRGATAIAADEPDADEDPSVAAGRHAEREAADTRATVERGVEDVKAAPAADSPAVAAAASAAPPSAQPPTRPPAKRDAPPPKPSATESSARAAPPGGPAVADAAASIEPDKASGGGGARVAPSLGVVALDRITVGARAGLSAAVVETEVRARLAAMTSCYATVLAADADATATIQVRLEIGTDGAVTAAVVSSPAKPGPLGACASRGLQASTYPTAAGGSGTTAKVTLRFLPP